MDRGLVEHLAEPAMNRCLYGFYASLESNKYLAYRVRLGSIPKEVRTDLWLSSTSDAEKSVRLYVGFPGSELSPSSSNKFDIYFRESVDMMQKKFVFCQLSRYVCTRKIQPPPFKTST